MSIKLCKDTIQFLIKNPNYKGKKILSKKSSIFFKKNFNESVVLKINELIKSGLVKKYIKNKKKIKLIKF